MNNKTKELTKLKENIARATNEKGVQDAYLGYLKTELASGEFLNFYGYTDGILSFEEFDVLCEFKYDKNITNNKIKCSVLAQALVYIIQQRKNDGKIPSVVLIGTDKHQCIIPTKNFQPYLNENGKWSKILSNYTSASEISKDHPQLIEDMMKDPEFEVLLSPVQEFDIELFKIFKQIGKDPSIKIKITKDNILSIANQFRFNVMKGTQLTLEESSINTQLRDVDLLFNIITDGGKTNLINSDDNLVVNRRIYQNINGKKYKLFRDRYGKDIYTTDEKDELISIKDTLIEDLARRHQGAFFTSIEIVKLAHEYISRYIGNDWKEKHVVWDSSSGTNNLTRFTSFKELYNSTLEQGDVDTVIDVGYGGINFQYDFLNHGVEKLPEPFKGYIRDAERRRECKRISPKQVDKYMKKDFRKPLLFLQNPPYVAPTSGVNKKPRKGVSNNKYNIIYERMKDEKDWGVGIQELYIQFLDLPCSRRS